MWRYKNRENHTKTTSGTGTCGTYLVESCTKGCGYSISNYVEHDIEYYTEDKIYDETGKILIEETIDMA